LANQPETPVYDASVLQWETTTSALGGAGGVMNTPLLQLSNRTTYLKQQVDKQNVIDAPGTITVGAGQQFNTLQEAWDSLIGAIILAPVTISIADGTYNQSIITLSKQPFSQFIRIEGNLGSPANVVFNFTPSGGVSEGMICDGVVGLQLAGFKLQGVIGETKRLLQSINSASIICDSASIVFQGGDRGIECLSSATIDAQSMTITGCTISVLASTSANAEVSSCNITGVSNAFGNLGIRALGNAYIQANGVTISNAGYGISAQDGGVVGCLGASVLNCDRGFSAQHGQIICAGSVSTDHTTFGFRAEKGGIINGLIQGSFGVVQATSALIGSQVGFSADDGGNLNVDGAAAIRQSKGYDCSQMGRIRAPNTSVNNFANTTNYDPAVSGFASDRGGRSIEFS